MSQRLSPSSRCPGPHDQPCLRAMPTVVYENDSPAIRYSPEPQPISSTYAFPFPPGCA